MAGATLMILVNWAQKSPNHGMEAAILEQNQAQSVPTAYRR